MAEKFNQRDLERACDDLAMLRFWTSDLREPVMHLLAKMCPHREALRWLVAELVNRIGTWPGPAELRGLLCTRYDPADGIDHWSTLPGYRAEDCESRHYEQHQALKAGGYEQPDELVKKLAASKAMQLEPEPAVITPPKKPPASEALMIQHEIDPPTTAELEAIRRESEDPTSSPEARALALKLLEKYLEVETDSCRKMPN